MKKTPSFRLFLVMLLPVFFSFFVLTGCTQETTTAITYTVSFDSNGGSEVASVQVEYGRKITASMTDPTKDDSSEFVGWFKDNDTFLIPWNFAVDIVTSDVTLYAKWITVQAFPTEVTMTDDPFSSSLTWVQGNLSDESSLTITFYPGTPATRQEIQYDEDGAEITVTIEYYEYPDTGTQYVGTITKLNDTSVTWSSDTEIPGGVYQIKIETSGQDDVVVPDLYFKGSGTETNPYLLYESDDMQYLSTTDAVGEGEFYKVAHIFSHEVAYAEIEGNTFLGDFDGNGLTVTVSGNAGMFYELGADAHVHDLTIAGTITSASVATLGGLAIINNGLIENVTSRTAITSSAGTVGDPETKDLGGAGGIVGINQEDGIIQSSTFIGSSSSDGVIKSYIGGGGIASINYGLIDDCTNMGVLGAYNSVESGKSMSNYSYMGGIAGFNYGTISKSRTTSTGKLLGQRYYNNGEPTDTSNNRVIGGIVGYNAAGAVVTESFFNGIRVHGDQYVGGIAGINAGTISYNYTGARYYTSTETRSYVAGRLNVGGIAGALEGDGVVTNCYNAANVYAYDDLPYAIAATATDSVYLYVNHDLRATGEQTNGNASTDNPVAPEGTGNIMENNTPLATGDGVYYKLPAVYASVLGDKFVASNDETLLVWQVA